MILDRLTLKRFRNIPGCTLEFHPVENWIIGPNGSGKTNILESIFYLSTFRSMRNYPDRELVMNGSTSFTVSGHGHGERCTGTDVSLQYSLNDGKKLFIDKKKSTGYRRYSVHSS